jgi:hypothetical protein
VRAQLTALVLSANPALLAVLSRHADEVIATLGEAAGPSQRVMAVVARKVKTSSA